MSKDDLCDDFRAYLQLEFSKRCKKNPRYSLRAFAVNLSEDPSSLSQFLRSKRNLSAKKMKEIALKLGIDAENFEKFVVNNSSPEYRKLAADHFMFLSNWYHMAICELVQTKDFIEDDKWISKKLGVSTTEARGALDRLKRLGWLKYVNDKMTFSESEGGLTTIDTDIDHFALAQFQKQMLTKAVDAVDEFPMDKRSQSGMTMSISTKKLEKANEMITKFRRSLCQFLEDDKEHDDVYHLSISLFPLTKN